MLTSAISLAKICLSLGLVAAFGILGAAYSALCAAAVLLVLAWRGGQRRYCIHYRHLTNLLVVAMAFLIFITSEMLGQPFRTQALHLVDVMTPLLPVSAALLPAAFHDAVLAKLPLLLDMLIKLGLCSLMLGLVPVIYAQRKREPLINDVSGERPVV